MAGKCECDGCTRKITPGKEFCPFCGASQKEATLIFSDPQLMAADDSNFINAVWEDAGKS